MESIFLIDHMAQKRPAQGDVCYCTNNDSLTLQFFIFNSNRWVEFKINGVLVKRSKQKSVQNGTHVGSSKKNKFKIAVSKWLKNQEQTQGK